MEKEATGPTTASPKVATKKRGGPMTLFRSVVLAFRGTSSKKSSVSSNMIVNAATIKTLVNGVRPLHHQLDYALPPPPPPPPSSMALDAYYDVHMPPPSPCSSDAMSRYASAEDLQSLDKSEDNEEEDISNGEANAIDMKAEEFIAMFYKQMRLQRLDSLKLIDEEAKKEKQLDSSKIVEEEATTEKAADEGTVEETAC